MTDPASGNPEPHHDAAHLAHHFDTPQQQFNAGKLGMWLFVLTEILLFGGLFCVYAVYRANHPEIFFYAEQFLDKRLGAINTAILITSSLTMAWAVRSAQLSQRRGLVLCLALTLVCACGFLGIKVVEYQHKWHDGLLWASKYDPHPPAADQAETHEPDAQLGAGLPTSPARAGSRDPRTAEHEPDGEVSPEDEAQARKNAGIFFSIYFLMTGLHAIHVLAGMGAITWILVRSVKGHFGSQYFGPVDFVGLYWHVVDLIWIYLFPLLYLIH